MRWDTQQYLERLGDARAAGCEHPTGLIGAGVEPFAWGAELRYSPRRTKLVMREVLQHHLLDIQVLPGSDGRNELRMTWNRETERWYARILRSRRATGEQWCDKPRVASAATTKHHNGRTGRGTNTS